MRWERYTFEIEYMDYIPEIGKPYEVEGKGKQVKGLDGIFTPRKIVNIRWTKNGKLRITYEGQMEVKREPFKVLE